MPANQSVLAALDPVRRRAETKGLALEVDLAPATIYVEADPERLEQILGNLLSNALNYTERGHITVSMRQEATHASVSVKDTGIGVDPGQIASLFNAFHRMDEGRQTGGLGMGLWLVRRLVEMHGGTVEFRSEGRGLGSEVTFTLPLVRSAAKSRSSLDIVMPAARRILVVDDQPDVADMLGTLLESMGQDVRVAYRGEDALEIALRQRPQVAFVDLAMPGMSGAEVARYLRQQAPASELTLVAVSGYPRDNAALAGTGFEYQLLKPATVENIVTLLNSLSAKSHGDGKFRLR